jgi:hypothetical protein
MGIRASNRHSLQHIWSTCKVKALAYLLVKRRLSWLGHVAKLSKTKYLHIVLFAQLKGTMYGCGKPPQTFRSTLCKDLEVADIPFRSGEWYVEAKDKPLWR